jgi:flagellar FliL protein
MSDEDMGDGLDGGEPGGEKSSKKSGLAAFLPNLLKFIAIGLGALVFIVTVAVFTFNIMSKGGKSQTQIAEASSYIGKRPEYAFFSNITTIRTRTRDVAPYSVVVDMVIGYDMNDKNASMEMTSRAPQIQDFMRNFFATKYAADLKPEKEDLLKEEIVDALNTRVLDSTRAKIVLFKTFEVMDM